MGNTASNINWNPGDSTLGRTISGQSGGAFKGGVDYNPADSTAGAFANGNYGDAANQAAGGLGNIVKTGGDLSMALLNPAGGVSDLYNSISGTPQAAQRTATDRAGAAAQGAQEQQYGQQQQANAAANAAQQAATNTANTTNQTYLTNQANTLQAQQGEDAFNAARNAARQKNGTTLYGGWG